MASKNDDDQPSSAAFKERRFKLSRACDRCRRRRIKCDEGHPCQACLSANSACTFEEPGKKTHPHNKSKRTATLEDRMLHLETLIQAIPPAVFAAGGALSGSTSTLQLAPDSSTSPLASFASSSHTFPSGVPPPSLHVFPLMNPSTHFTSRPRSESRTRSPGHTSMLSQCPGPSSPSGDLTERTSKMALSASYLYIDDEGYTRWQGETSGLPLLDLLMENHGTEAKREQGVDTAESSSYATDQGGKTSTTDWFPNRTPRRPDINPQAMWRLITTHIAPDLMDSLVQCYLCTSYYLVPFLHVPTFLADYGNPSKWGEPGFAQFIVSMCCLASRHTEDPRVRADPNDGVSAGTHWFELFCRLHTLPIADRPTLYTIQANLIAAVYAVGLGRLSKAAALLSEAVTFSVDCGLHRSVDTYDLFDPIEDQIRKRTFWSVYLWDKLLCAHFGRPPVLRLRDCDAGEPVAVDDEFITRENIGAQPVGTESRMSAFICVIRLMVVLESVLDIPPPRRLGDTSPFLLRASSTLAGTQQHKDLREEEALLDEIHLSIPAFWSHSSETLRSMDVIRVTQAERIHCAEQFVRMLISRHRFSEYVAERAHSGAMDETQSDAEKEATTAAHTCALHIVSTYLHIATKGLMTYYGVHVIHQLTQAGRTFIAILLNCKSESLQPLIPTALDALRSCVGLLRRFSGRYVCGQRSGDLMEEFCRITQIPLEPNRSDGSDQGSDRPPWIRPVRKKVLSAPRSNDSASQHSSPEAFSPEFFADMNASFASSRNSLVNASSPQRNHPHQQYTIPGPSSPSSIPTPFMDISGSMSMDDPSIYVSPADIMAMFNDGEVDMASLFLPGTDFAPNHATRDGIGGYSASVPPYRKVDGAGNEDDLKMMMGAVSSP